MTQLPATPVGADVGLPGLPDADYLVGYGRRGRTHAVAWGDALEAYDQATVSRRAGREHALPFTLPVCAEFTGLVMVAGRAGVFDRANPAVVNARDVCPTCAWMVAADRGTLGAELDALTPTGPDRHVLATHLGDPDLLRRLCRAVLLADSETDRVAHTAAVAAEGDGDPDAWALLTAPSWEITGPDGPAAPGPGTLAVLGHVAGHGPVVAYPLDCLEETCDHDPDQPGEPDTAGRPGRGCAGEASLMCPGCSLSAGGWAGGFEGYPVLTVPAPCGVLAAAGAAYHVAIPPAAPPERPAEGTR